MGCQYIQISCHTTVPYFMVGAMCKEKVMRIKNECDVVLRRLIGTVAKMSMIVEIFFVKLEGSSLDKVQNHHVDVIDVADEKAIVRCWEAVAQKFGFVSSAMYVYEGYLTQSEVLPTSDDLQRIWLTYLQQADGRIDTDVCHLCLRFFVSNNKHNTLTTATTPPTATTVATPTTAATPMVKEFC